jgi:phage terminase large subunit-like protein
VKRTLHGRRRAARVIRFIETLTVPSGMGQGKRFKLAPWQKRFIRDIYEPHRMGRRVVRRAILSIARKNGKNGADRDVGAGASDRAGIDPER